MTFFGSGMRSLRCSPVVVVIAVLVAAFAPLAARSGGEGANAGSDGFPGWPATYEGRALEALPLTAREASFIKGFPAALAGFAMESGRLCCDGLRHRHASCIRPATVFEVWVTPSIPFRWRRILRVGIWGVFVRAVRARR